MNLFAALSHFIISFFLCSEVCGNAGVTLACVPLAAATKRRPHMHKGRAVYYWEQNVDDVNIYIPLPKKVCFSSPCQDSSFHFLPLVKIHLFKSTKCHFEILLADTACPFFSVDVNRAFLVFIAGISVFYHGHEA